MFKPFWGAALGLILATSLAPATAQTPDGYPARSIRLIVPYAAGGGTDVLARRLANELSAELGQTVYVDNQGGAGGLLGMQQAAEAAPDGYTIVLALNAQFAVNSSLYPKLPYDSVKQFAPVSLLARAPYVLVVNADVPAKSLRELIALAKSEPGKLTYASAGNGSGAHLSTELLKTAAGIDLVHVPYKGAGPAYPDLLSGRIDVMFSTYAPIEGYLKAGKLRALGVTTAERSPALPDLPALGETLPNYVSDVWYAVAAPAGTPRPIIDRLNAAFLKALKSPAIKKQLAIDAIQSIGSTPEELRDYIPAEIEKWGKVVRAAGAHLD